MSNILVQIRLFSFRYNVHPDSSKTHLRAKKPPHQDKNWLTALGNYVVGALKIEPTPTNKSRLCLRSLSFQLQQITSSEKRHGPRCQSSYCVGGQTLRAFFMKSSRPVIVWHTFSHLAHTFTRDVQIRPQKKKRTEFAFPLHRGNSSSWSGYTESVLGK